MYNAPVRTLALLALPAFLAPACGSPARGPTPPRPAEDAGAPRDVAQASDSAGQDATTDVTPEGHRVAVAVGGTGAGRVSSDPPGIDCPGDCVGYYLTGTRLVLTPAAAEGSRFDRWAGACAGQGEVVALTIAGSGTCTAFFEPL